MTTIEMEIQDLVELDEREVDGIRVTMIWDRRSHRVSVLVYDARTDECFSLEVRDGDSALDVFRHPFAYAAHRLVEDVADAYVTCG